jgi:hypothetical protein
MEPLGGFANYGAAELARLTDTAQRTARRWIRAGLAPRFVVRFLRLLRDAPLGELNASWNGWSLRRGKLVSPDGHEFTPGEVQSIPHRQMQLSELERRAREQPAEPEPEQRPRPQRRQSRAGGSDFFDDLSPVTRDHLASVLRSIARESLPELESRIPDRRYDQADNHALFDARA